MKFANPDFTASNEPRAYVEFSGYQTLWFNTGTLCNLACKGCYIESSPTNDALMYISFVEFETFLNEIVNDELSVKTIGFTGGEPFMNPDLLQMLELALSRGFEVLLLTNAMRPMEKHLDEFLTLRQKFGNTLLVRVSIDHYTQNLHEEVRGTRSWKPMVKGLKWLSDNGFNLSVAARTMWNESEALVRKGFAEFFKAEAIKIDAGNVHALTLFPELAHIIFSGLASKIFQQDVVASGTSAPSSISGNKVRA